MMSLATSHSPWILSAAALLGCSDVECAEGEVAIGDQCFALRDASAATAAPADSELDGATASEEPLEGRRDASVRERDGGLRAPSELPAGDARADSGTACSELPEQCDGEDNDCDGEIDEGLKTRCWPDGDADGFAAPGSAALLVCGMCGAQKTSVEPRDAQSSDCDDSHQKRSPAASDVCGDAIDNDCDGVVDDEKNNVCGGACTMQLIGRPGEACSNGLLGACAKTGTYECQGSGAIACSAAPVAGTAEVCDDVDNDCDGEVDEGLSATWYRDCDGDGYAANMVGRIDGCMAPKATADCKAWTKTAPSATTTDCDDTTELRHPEADFGYASLSSGDRNCDGKIDHRVEFVAADSPYLTGSTMVRLCFMGDECGCVNTTSVVRSFEGFAAGRAQYDIDSYMQFFSKNLEDLELVPPPCAIDSKHVILGVLLTCSGADDVWLAVRHLCR